MGRGHDAKFERSVPAASLHQRDANGADDAMHRRYNRWWSRFDQPDPYDGSYDVTDPQSFNRYAYVHNDPVNFVDPTGLLVWAPNIGNFTVDVPISSGSPINSFMWQHMFWSPGGGSGGGGDISGGGGGGGAGGGGGDQEPAKPSHSRSSKSDCENFVDKLVSKVTANSDAQQLGRNLINDGVNDYKAGYGKEAPHSGFKEGLTNHGQQGDVYRHVMFVAGGQLLVGGGLTAGNFSENIARHMVRMGGGLDLAAFQAYDRLQAWWSGPASQHGAEHRGNQAGFHVGNSMLKAYGLGRTPGSLTSLAQELKTALCGD